MPSAVVREGRIQVRVYVRFVTKCFGSNISTGIFIGGCGFPVTSKFCIGGFCNGAPPNRTLMFYMCGICVGGILVVGALGVGGVDFTLKCCTVMRVYCYHLMDICVPRVGPGPWSVVREGQQGRSSAYSHSRAPCM